MDWVGPAYALSFGAASWTELSRTCRTGRTCQPIALDLEEVVGEGGAFEAGDVVGEMAKGGEFAVGVGLGVDVTSHGDVLELGPEEEFGSDGGFWMLDSGCWILDAGFWILDSG